jgi:hypothetical protein
MTKIEQATAGIVSAARENPCITVAGLWDEVERGDVWIDLAVSLRLTHSDWTAAMVRAIEILSV